MSAYVRAIGLSTTKLAGASEAGAVSALRAGDAGVATVGDDVASTGFFCLAVYGSTTNQATAARRAAPPMPPMTPPTMAPVLEELPLLPPPGATGAVTGTTVTPAREKPDAPATVSPTRGVAAAPNALSGTAHREVALVPCAVMRAWTATAAAVAFATAPPLDTVGTMTIVAVTSVPVDACRRRPCWPRVVQS